MVNGIDLAGLSDARDAIRRSPEAGKVSYGVLLRWKGGTQIEAEAQPMSVGGERIDRDFKWTIDEPPQILGKGSGPTPRNFSCPA